MLYVVTVETFPEGTLIGSLGEFYYRPRAEKDARKHSHDMGPNFLVIVTTTDHAVTPPKVKGRKAYRYGRVHSLRRT